MKLVARGPDLWTVDHDQRVAGLRLGTRMSIVRLSDGRLWLHSAVPLDEPTAAAIDALGDVAWIVAPNLFHHLHLASAHARWPAASLVSPAALAGKVPWLSTAAAWRPFEATPAPAWAPEIVTVEIGGAPKVQERAFFLPGSRTLLVTDAVFNLTRPEGLWSRVMLTLMGSAGGPRQGRYLRSLVKDRAAFADAMRAIIGLDPVGLVPCHGEVLGSGAAAAIETAAAWVLGTQK